jgi:hypothetical protein
MFTKRLSPRGNHGFALVETLFGVGIAAMLLLAVVAFSIFCGHSFAALFNYVELDDANRIAIDTLTRDVRQASRVSGFNSTGTALALQYVSESSVTNTVSYVYDPLARTFSRISGGERRVLLRGCKTLRFSLGQRNTDVGGYDVFPVATDFTLAKVINVSWVCARKLTGVAENTESVQTARIVIRKQSAI